MLVHVLVRALVLQKLTISKTRISGSGVMTSERATTEVFGLSLTAVFVGLLILNALTFWLTAANASEQCHAFYIWPATEEFHGSLNPELSDRRRHLRFDEPGEQRGGCCDFRQSRCQRRQVTAGAGNSAEPARFDQKWKAGVQEKPGRLRAGFQPVRASRSRADIHALRGLMRLPTSFR